MNRRRFFALVWRVNGLLILVTGVLACGVLGFASWQIYRGFTRTRYASNVVNVADEQIDRSKARLGTFERIEGTSVLRAALMIEQQYGFSSGSKETRSVQNYLFYDPATGNSHWLVPGNRGLILSTHQLPERDYGERKKTVVAFIYELVEADTNGDHKLTTNDARVIAMSDPAGLRFARLVSGVDELNGSELTHEGRIVILYTASGTLKAADIDLETQKVLRESSVQPVAQSAQN